MPDANPPQHDAAPRFRLDNAAAGATLVLQGDWIAQAGTPASLQPAPITTPLHFDTTGLGRWDSGLIGFLWQAKCAAPAIDTTGLPPAATKLLALLPTRPYVPPAVAHRSFRPVQRLGHAATGLVTELGLLVRMACETAEGAVLAVFGRTRIRGVDLLANIYDAGPSALIIVGVVNFLIGAILAFVGAAQLRKFAADAYVANLVGLALVREMAAVMTAIVMAGRTGGAYAARIATMQGNEEIDALRVIGIPVSDYIVLPSVMALVLTMPLLYLYGCLVGLIGGFTMAIAMLNITAAGYLHQTFGAVRFDQFVFGFGKSIAFALLIGVTSCRIGLQAGRSAADVGTAATSAVVTGIVGVIAMDAIFAVLANTIGI